MSQIRYTSFRAVRHHDDCVHHDLFDFLTSLTTDIVQESLDAGNCRCVVETKAH